MTTRFKAFAAQNVVPLTILVVLSLAMVFAGIISWTNFGIFVAGWLLGWFLLNF